VRSADYIPRPSRRKDGRGVVRLNGKDHFLGCAGEWPEKSKSPPSTINAEYQALIARWLANGRSFPEEADVQTVNDVMLAYPASQSPPRISHRG
jgi:hypothetical protein